MGSCTVCVQGYWEEGGEKILCAVCVCVCARKESGVGAVATWAEGTSCLVTQPYTKLMVLLIHYEVAQPCTSCVCKTKRTTHS